MGLLCAVIGGYPIFSEALEDVWSKRMTMEFSMTIALTAALIVGEVFTALVILLFLLIAEVLEKKTVGRGRQAIHALTEAPRLSSTLPADSGLPHGAGFACVRPIFVAH